MADPLYLTMNDRPRAILRTMDNLVETRKNLQERHKKRRWIPLLLFLAGFPFLFFDIALGYNFCTFALVALGLWIAALFLGIYSRAIRPKGEFGSQFQTAREVIHTLRDDLGSERLLFGHLDLTGTRLATKMTGTKKTAAGRDVQLYRDEWLSLKGKLYDGNILRVSIINWSRVRKGYFKRGSSGKSKWKSEKARTGQELKLRVTVNADAYEIAHRPELKPGLQIGSYTVTSVNATDGMIQISAVAAGDAGAPDILWVMRWAYYLLEQRRVA